MFAIGNPFGLDWTLTTGIVSALDRSLPGEAGGPAIDHLIQTDAAINPGNSGGPLLDSAGRLIGINTAIYSPSGASAGIGFAVPVDTVMRVVPQLIKTGKYIRPALGIEVDEQLNQRLLAPTGSKGVFVLRVTLVRQRTRPASRVSKSRRKASCRATASSMLMARRRTMAAARAARRQEGRRCGGLVSGTGRQIARGACELQPELIELNLWIRR